MIKYEVSCYKLWKLGRNSHEINKILFNYRLLLFVYIFKVLIYAKHHDKITHTQCMKYYNSIYVILDILTKLVVDVILQIPLILWFLPMTLLCVTVVFVDCCCVVTNSYPINFVFTLLFCSLSHTLGITFDNLKHWNDQNTIISID